MKMYEKLGIDPTTEEGILRLLSFGCGELPAEMRKCGNYVSCGLCKFNYLMSEVKEREIDWTKVPKDTPVLVRRDGGAKERRYFK